MRIDRTCSGLASDPDPVQSLSSRQLAGPNQGLGPLRIPGSCVQSPPKNPGPRGLHPQRAITPNAALTSQRFGALRNPPVSERSHPTPGGNPVGFARADSLENKARRRKNCRIGPPQSPYFRHSGTRGARARNPGATSSSFAPGFRAHRFAMPRNDELIALRATTCVASACSASGRFGVMRAKAARDGGEDVKHFPDHAQP
jgi:hypothetical protein